VLLAITVSYRYIKCILNSAVITARIGVRQGAPTSCLLFVLYVDNLVRKLKETFDHDGFLGMLHALLLMDDTVLLATSRNLCIRKINTLLEFCNDSGMSLNQKKTMFMVINGNTADRQPIACSGSDIQNTNHYVYLGAHFTQDGKLSSVIERHAQDASKQVNKFAIFVRNNPTMPFVLKRRVFEAALTSSILYSSETWLSANVKTVAMHYTTALKRLLGVRTTTTNILCYLESGHGELHSVILKRQIQFVHNFSLRSSNNEPLAHALDLARQANTKSHRHIQRVMDYDGDPVLRNLEELRQRCLLQREHSTRLDTYLCMNPDLVIHPVYTNSSVCIPDYKRVSFTQMRLSSHRLKIETGRWIRLPRESRVCSCDNKSIQNEHHVIFDCPQTLDIRQRYHTLFRSQSLTDIFNQNDIVTVCNVMSNIMKLYC
jgi:hypothetical protein